MQEKNSTMLRTIVAWVISIAAIVLLIAAIVYVWWILGTSPQHWFHETVMEPGTYGDMFGMVNSLFSALAFAGVIVTLLLQMYELRQNRKEYVAMVDAQERSADTSLLAAKFNSFQSTVSSMNSLLDKYPHMPIRDMIAVRNNLWLASKTISLMINAKKWDDITLPIVPQFLDDELMISLDDVLETFRQIASESFRPLANRHETWPYFIELRAKLIDRIRQSIRLLGIFSSPSHGDYKMFRDFEGTAIDISVTLQELIDEINPVDDQVMSKLEAGHIPGWTVPGYWGTFEKKLSPFYNNFRHNSIAWAKLGSVVS